MPCESWLFVILVVVFVPVIDGTTTGPANANSSSPKPSPPRAVQCVVIESGDGRNKRLDCDGEEFVSAKWIEQQTSSTASEAGELEVGTEGWYYYVGLTLCCITCAALAAGLTMGLMSLDEWDMSLLLHTNPEDEDEVKGAKTADEREQKLTAMKNQQAYAEKINPLIADHYFGERCIPHALNPTNHHYLLVTLLVLNATANEALPLFLDKLVPAWLACLLSVTMVLIFGEIIPSAIFTGPSQLLIVSKLASTVACAKMLFMPIVWPISLFLDKVLGHESQDRFSRAKITTLVNQQFKNDKKSEILAGLDEDEVTMIRGVLELHQKRPKDICRPMKDAYSLKSNAVLGLDTMASIMDWSHSRLLVYDGDKDNIMGVLIVKKLIVVNPDDNRKLDSLHILRKPAVLSDTDTLLQILNHFQVGRSHVAILSSDPEAVKKAWAANTPIPVEARPTMFCTLEDVIEELLKEEIHDEDDHDDFQHVIDLPMMGRLRQHAEAARRRVAEGIKKRKSRDLRASVRIKSDRLSQGLLASAA